MTIKSKKNLAGRKMEIDLTGEQGNAYVLMGIASNLAKQLDKNKEDIIKRMMAGDYEDLLKVFKEEFGDYVDMYR